MSADWNGDALTSLACPLCDWQSIEVRDVFRVQLTPDWQAHYQRAHMPRPIVRQRAVALVPPIDVAS